MTAPEVEMPPGCPTGKKPYRNGAEAWRAQQGFTARKGPAPTLQAFRCELCSAWHLGRKPLKAKHAKRRANEKRMIRREPGR